MEGEEDRVMNQSGTSLGSNKYLTELEPANPLQGVRFLWGKDKLKKKNATGRCLERALMSSSLRGHSKASGSLRL